MPKNENENEKNVFRRVQHNGGVGVDGFYKAMRFSLSLPQFSIRLFIYLFIYLFLQPEIPGY